LNKGWLRNLWVGAVIAGFFVLIYLLAHHWWSHDFVLRTLDFVVQALASRSGISPFLVRGLVILLTIPFFWAVAKYTHGLFWLRGVGPSLGVYRNPYGIVIVGYAGLFFIATYFASLHAYAYKWCAETPEGIETFDGPVKDPVYGIEAKPCTFEQIVTIRETKKGISGSQRLQIGDARRFAFFDVITGKPRVWFYKLPEGGYEFYDGPGKHPGTGQDLRPINPEMVQELIRQQDLANAQRSAKELEARQQDAEQAAAAQNREHQAFLDQYINTAVAKSDGTRIVAILMLGEGQDSSYGLESALVGALSKEGIDAVSSFFKPPFAQEGRARKFVRGDWNEASRLDLSKRVDYVISASSLVSYSPYPQLDGLITADLQMQLKCFNVVVQRVCGSEQLNTKGAGFTKVAALESASNNAKSEIEAFVKTLRFD
jgi:hypothetical protein